MTKQQVLDHGYVELVESWGSDERIVEAARMSTAKGFLGWGPKCSNCQLQRNRIISESFAPDSRPCPGCGARCKTVAGDEKLLKHLWTNRHATPFEMAGMIIEVKAPIMVFREWHRHRTQCLTGDAMIACVSPRGTTYQRSIKNIFELKHGNPCAPSRTRNGTTKGGKAATREARRKQPGRSRVLPNCQNRVLRVLDENTGVFTTAPMKAVWESGTKAVFLLETEGGHAVRASAEHPFLTRRGWVKMKDIKVGDCIARMGKVAAQERPIPPALRQGIGVWTTMMRSRLIAEEDGCYICGEEFQRDDLYLDHVIPVSESLLTALDERNLRPVCAPCHRKKTNTEQPERTQMSRRGVRWERVRTKPKCVGEEPTYDIEVDGPHHNYVANGLVVHNSYNEMSARYVPLPDENYVPSLLRVLNGANTKTTNKQAQNVNGKVLSEPDALDWLASLAEVYAQAQRVYERGLELGVPKELARLPVPVARYSVMRASANLRNWIGFLQLRKHKAAQWEIRQYADVVAQLIACQFERVHKVARSSYKG